MTDDGMSETRRERESEDSRDTRMGGERKWRSRFSSVSYFVQ